MDDALSLIIRVLVLFILVVALVDMCMSIHMKRKTLRTIDVIDKRFDILMKIPIKKARSLLSDANKERNETDSEKTIGSSGALK